MRFLAWIFLTFTVVAVIFDWLLMTEGGDFILRPLGQLLSDIFGTGTVTLIQSSIERHVSAEGIFEPFILPLLISPAGIVFGLAFLFFHVMAAVFSRPKQYLNLEPL